VKLHGTDVTVEKGTRVLLPVFALHHDPKYYPDPERFDPERFCEEEKKKRPQFAYLPFGEGPRICIGKYYFLLYYTV
jgi:cytochrome P450